MRRKYLLTLVLLVGCSDNRTDPASTAQGGGQSKATVVVIDLSKTRSKTEWRSDPRCVRNNNGRSSGDVYVFNASRKFVGKWELRFEASRFVDMASNGVEGAWLDTDALTSDQLAKLKRVASLAPDGSIQGVFNIKFVGRRAACGNRWSGYGYGHLGAYPDLIVADRIISIEVANY